MALYVRKCLDVIELSIGNHKVKYLWDQGKSQIGRYPRGYLLQITQAG